MCHLDADMTRQGLDGLAAGDVELAVLENVGNLVCPAEFDTGAVKNAAILSVPEGDDKPLKYPLMFQICDVVLINKTDVLPYFDFDMEKCRKHPHAQPERQGHPHLRQDGRGRGRMGRLAARRSKSLARLNRDRTEKGCRI